MKKEYLASQTWNPIFWWSFTWLELMFISEKSIARVLVEASKKQE